MDSKAGEHERHRLEKEACATELRANLARAKSLRQAANEDPVLREGRNRLRSWQAERLARTHRDLLESPRFGPAAAFFLSDLYGPKDFSHRDEEVERIVPTLVRVLPLAALRTVAVAIGVDAISEELDAAMVRALQRASHADRIDDDAYARAYRACGERPLRERQIAMIDQVGIALERLTHTPLLATALRLMRAPAHLAGLGELQEFLESGYSAFKHMGAADEFLEKIRARERDIMERLFAGRRDPFALE